MCYSDIASTNNPIVPFHRMLHKLSFYFDDMLTKYTFVYLKKLSGASAKENHDGYNTRRDVATSGIHRFPPISVPVLVPSLGHTRVLDPLQFP